MITDQIVKDTRIHDWVTAVMIEMQALSGLEIRTSLGFFLFFYASLHRQIPLKIIKSRGVETLTEMRQNRCFSSYFVFNAEEPKLQGAAGKWLTIWRGSAIHLYPGSCRGS